MRAIAACAVVLAFAGCIGQIGDFEGDPDDSSGTTGPSGSSSSSASTGGAVSSSSSSSTSSGQGGATTSAGSGGATTTSGAGGATTSSGAGGATTTSTGSGGRPDPYAAARVACVNRINELRATQGAAALGTWTAGEACADAAANSDQASGTPHGAFGTCGESSQNECLGQGPTGVVSCLDSMWAEQYLAGCSGCEACAGAYTPNCPNCDFYGDDTGDVCGHYVNMRAEYYSEVACGFSDVGGWVVINFR